MCKNLQQARVPRCSFPDPLSEEILERVPHQPGGATAPFRRHQVGLGGTPILSLKFTHSHLHIYMLTLTLITTCHTHGNLSLQHTSFQRRHTHGGGAQERMETLRKSNWRGTCYVMPCKCASARVLIEATVCALIYVMHSQGGVAYSQPRHNPFAVVA